MDGVIALLGAILGGGGISSLIALLVARADAKKNRTSEILEAIAKLTGKVEKLEGKMDERNAVACRIRILRFYDEMRSGIRHTKDSWDQCMSDITTYNQYCEDHKDFKNNQTEATVGYIDGEYRDRLAKNDFE